jgi:hypothetical protein
MVADRQAETSMSREILALPSSGPSGHLLPEGEGIDRATVPLFPWERAGVRPAHAQPNIALP